MVNTLNTQELRLFYCLIANTLIFYLDDEIKNIGVYYYISGVFFLCAHDIISCVTKILLLMKVKNTQFSKPAGTL